MPVDAKPLFRPDVLRSHLAQFAVAPARRLAAPETAALGKPVGLRQGRYASRSRSCCPTSSPISSAGCSATRGRPAAGPRYTISCEKHVEVDGKFADAVLGEFNGEQRYVVAVEGKGPEDPLDRPFAGRKMSAVDQGYRYAINLPCDWIIVTSMRQTRLYHKGADQHTYERFDTEAPGRRRGRAAPVRVPAGRRARRAARRAAATSTTCWPSRRRSAGS